MPYLTIPSGRVFYKDYAPTNGSRRATLLLHNGLGSTHCFYHPIAALLTSPGHSYRLISYDCISSGLSTLSKSPQTIHTLAADAEAVLDALGVKEKVIFVGHSLGGVVAAVLAATREDWACAAVMLGPILPSDSMTDLAEARIEAVERKGMESMADTLPMGATGRTATPTQRAFIRTLLLSQKPEGYVKMCQVIAGAELPDYKAIKMPSLLIAGDWDKSASLGGCLEIYKRTGGRKYIDVIEGMGHWHCVEEPERVGKAIGFFVEQVIEDNAVEKS